MAKFYVICPLGLEELLKTEILEIAPRLLSHAAQPQCEDLKLLEVGQGGVLIECTALFALQLHFFSKIASRVLMRIASFRALEFSMLEKELRNIDLVKLIGDQKFALKVSSQKSKLGQEKRIFETATRAWPGRLSQEKKMSQEFYLRAENDQFVLSLDLTGEHLHFRGRDRTLAGLAPIRETLAAALIRFLIDQEPLSVLQNVKIFDPMAGSGTLLCEADDLYKLLKSRSFAFENQSWAPALLKSDSFIYNYRQLESETWEGFAAWDQSQEARDRLSQLSLSRPLEITPTPNQSRTQQVWVVANPPYGERLKAIPSDQLRDILLASKPSRVAVILPENLARELLMIWPTNGWSIAKLKVQNGGIPCLFIRAVHQD